MNPPPKPYALLAELTYRCPLKCPYCSNPLQLARYRDELDTTTWQRVLDEARSLGERARRFVELHYDWEACLAPLDGILGRLGLVFERGAFVTVVEIRECLAVGFLHRFPGPVRCAARGQ